VLLTLPGDREIKFQNTTVNVTAIVGQFVALECAVQGRVDIYVTWSRRPSNSKLYNEKYGGVLGISDVTLSNGGVYNCSFNLTSQKGQVTTGTLQFYLTVKGDHLCHLLSHVILLCHVILLSHVICYLILNVCMFM